MIFSSDAAVELPRSKECPAVAALLQLLVMTAVPDVCHVSRDNSNTSVDKIT